jgi:hypothetical protein
MPSSSRSVDPTGLVLSTLGMLGLLLLLMSSFSNLPDRLHALIRSNAPMWGLVSAGLLFFGIRISWRQTYWQTTWSPSTPGKRFRSIVVYTHPDCPLCESAMDTLGNHRAWLPVPTEVNIQDDPLLQTQFQMSVPVVEIDGRIRFRGCVNETLLRRLIEGTPPQKSLRHR